MEIKDKQIEQLTDIILKVAMAHHDDISQSDENNAVEAAEKCHDLLTAWFAKEIVRRELEARVDEINLFRCPVDNGYKHRRLEILQKEANEKQVYINGVN